jgi:hypothetical protein
MDSSGTNLQKWTGGWPDCSATTSNDIAVRTPIRGITPPHQRVGRYIAGAHAEELGYCGGQNVMLYKTFNGVTKPLQMYVSVGTSERDDKWVFGLGDPADDNYKEMDWTTDGSPYGAVGFYVTYNASPTSRTSSPIGRISPGMGTIGHDLGRRRNQPDGGHLDQGRSAVPFSTGAGRPHPDHRQRRLGRSTTRA